ncbi:hypothetical protein G6F50_014232 [Rhizopus delemar]|uniref:Uncharacterized protein n=1 Tax=Rhizopus delemar TaxID=936053 RepID=A0A9P6Y7M4_9FUNG|nr:hypothetical protein G6F50_014232 [Rhizopus delemar]
MRRVARRPGYAVCVVAEMPLPANPGAMTNAPGHTRLPSRANRRRRGGSPAAADRGRAPIRQHRSRSAPASSGRMPACGQRLGNQPE